MRRTSKGWQTVIKWFPVGLGTAFTGYFLIAQDWMQGAISFLITASLSLWAKFSGAFMERLEEGAEERGRKTADFVLTQTDTIPGKLKWKFSGFPRKYAQTLVDQCLKVKTEGFNIGLPSLYLENVYVPLQVEMDIPQRISGGIPTGRNGSQQSQDIWHFLASNHRCIAILASPGSGKTTLLQHLALLYAQHRKLRKNAPKRLIPILLYLRLCPEQIIQNDPPPLAELLTQQVETKTAFGRLKTPPNWFQKRLDEGKCLVMLDGLDEVANIQERKEVSRWVNEQMETYPRSRFLLTSRPHGYEKELLHKVDIVLEVQPFTLSEIKEFIHKWYSKTLVAQENRNTPAVQADAEEKANHLIEALLQNPAIRQMASNPLLVTMIATIHYLGNALPGKRVELYREICDVMLGRRITAKRIDSPLESDENQKLLQILALELMEKEKREFTAAEGETIIQEQLAKYGTDLTPVQWLTQVKNWSGLLIEKELGRYEFSHLSFQEYLTAVQIKDTQQEERLIQNFHNSYWKETIRLYAAQGDATKLIQAALNKQDLHSLRLAYDCLQEAKEVNREVRQQLETILEEGLDSEDATIARLAARVKLSRRLDSLLALDDTISISPGAISWAEYRLFAEENSIALSPCHPGRAKDPVMDISYQDALGFCAWLTQNAPSLSQKNETQQIYFYRLPTEAEAQNLPNKKRPSYWKEGNARSSDRKAIHIVKSLIPAKYTTLINYLSVGDWEKANQETLQILSQDSQLTVESIRTLPKDVLRFLDLLWLYYSQGRFGLGVQAKIWEQIGGYASSFPHIPDKEVFNALMEHWIALDIERSLPQFAFDVVTVNKKGEEIQRQPSQNRYFSEYLGDGVILDLVSIPGGEFWMGTEEEEIKRLCQKYDQDYFKCESPQHWVKVSPFWMGKYPVTQAQWRLVAQLPKLNRDLDPDPARFKGHDLPVEKISWYDAVEFCDRLSQYTGRNYRLPSEAEWEYACRSVISQQVSVNSGKKYPPFHFGETITTELANYDGNYTYGDEPEGAYRDQTTPVGQFPANDFGLYDMHGNVWEWCTDEWHENYQGAPKDGRVWSNGNENRSPLRGGSWAYTPAYCRSAFRYCFRRRDDFTDGIGFRLCCVTSRT